MLANKKFAFLMGACIVAGAMMGCEEPNRLPPTPTCTGDACDSGHANSASYQQRDLVTVPEICKDTNSCLEAPECADGAAFAACLCATDLNRCRTLPACNGIGECNYACVDGKTVGGEEVCGWAVCSGATGCKNSCIPEQLPGDGDEDGDGILNRIERDSDVLNPCLKDSDGDGIPDGDEDLNHNGKYEPDLGETNPGDNTDPDTSNSKHGQQLALKKAICTPGNMLSGSDGSYKHLRVAKFADTVYTPATDASATAVRFDSAKYGVVGFYGSALAANGSQLLKSANLAQGSYIEESNATASVPMASWLNGKKYQNGYVNENGVNLQVVPDHTVNRYKYAITLADGETLESVRDKIAGKFQAGLSASTGATTCKTQDGDKDNNKAILYLERSTAFHKYGMAVPAHENIYSGALVCSKTNTDSKNGDLNAIKAMNILQDVISGTTVSPTAEGFASAPKGGYMPFKNFVCQAENYGSAAGSVDFIWVVDNSGSMKDELDTLAATVKSFAQKLDDTHINYRVAITTTDAYSVDEWPGQETSGAQYFDQYNVYLYDGTGAAARPNGVNTNLTNVNINYLGVHNLLLMDSVGFLDPDAIKSNVTCSEGDSGCEAESYELGQFVLGVRGTKEKACAGGTKTPLLDETKVCRSNADCSTDDVTINCVKNKDSDETGKCELLVRGGTVVANICGKGIEDGFKSGAETLRRLAVDVSKKNKPELAKAWTDDEWKQFRYFKRVTALSEDVYPYCRVTNVNESCTSATLSAECDETDILDDCLDRLAPAMTRDEALKYIIWVSDEESRQFKEEGKDGRLTNTKADIVYGCYTGYKLNYNANAPYDYSMARGHYAADDANVVAQGDAVCNPELHTMLSSMITAGTLTEDMSLADIKNAYPAYYHMLMYYMEEYRKYAGSGGIAAWAIVGDAGLAAGKVCKNLQVCNGTCCRDANCTEFEQTTAGVGCFDCKNGTWVDDPKATVGANYGLSYIHAARFLGTLTDDGKNDGKEGGFSSICNDDLDTTITEIYNDVAGRIASHPLKGYPISSTIKVAIYRNGNVVELTRGASKDGWTYDASQNAVIFTGLDVIPSMDDQIVISYVIWEEFNG